LEGYSEYSEYSEGRPFEGVPQKGVP